MDSSLRSATVPEPVVGIEIADAGTRIAALVETRQGIHTATHRNPTPPAPEEAIGQIVGLVQRLTRDAGEPAAALGIAVSGVVDAERGVVHALRYAPGWEEVALADGVAEATGLPVRLDSTTNAAALAEAMRGVGAAYRHILYVLPAQSVTAAYVVGGRILHGAHGMEGQLAHLRVRDEGPRCSCGAIGHVEPLASAQAIVRNMIGCASGSDASTAAMLRVSGGRAEAMSAAQVAQLAAEGEPAAVAVLTDALDTLATALACALALLDPDVVVLGGPLAQAESWYFDQLRARLSERRHPFATPPLVAGALEPRSALLGARLLASRSLSEPA
ncbi:MAG TPA: ROK family protein [Ktedonobacterales bacterium]|nr:ROK family protein [Ktedonobacterales bacterium]